MTSADPTGVVVGFVSVVIGLPVGFLMGWRAGWKEHLVRAREDRKAGICSECLRPIDTTSSPDCNTEGS